jgi:hypothetical protein
VLFAYLDESGDPGFTKLGLGGTSDYFVIAVLFVDDPLVVSTLVTEFKAHVGMPALEELKHSNSSPQRRRAFLQALRSADVAIGVMSINKAVVAGHPSTRTKDLFYEEIVCRGVRHFRDLLGDTRLTLDEYVRGQKQKAFDARLRQRVNEPPIYYLKTIKHEKSARNPLLQAADMVSGAVYRSRAHDDSSLLGIIRPRIHELWDWDGRDAEQTEE